MKTREEIIREAKALWKKRCAETYARKGDWGSCVLGAGIVREGAPLDHGFVRHHRDYLITAGEVSPAQGSCVWEESVEEVVAFLRERGIPCYYHPGRLD